jgi:hypothetical protein
LSITYSTPAAAAAGSISSLTAQIAVDYHRAALNGTEFTYAGLAQSWAYYSSPGMSGTYSYDISSQHLTGNSNGSETAGIGTYCSGPVASCSALNSEFLSSDHPTATYDIIFGDNLQSLSGTLVATSYLNNGGSIIRTYAIQAVPLPMSGILFGSTVFSLAALRRRSV